MREEVVRRIANLVSEDPENSQSEVGQQSIGNLTYDLAYDTYVDLVGKPEDYQVENGAQIFEEYLRKAPEYARDLAQLVVQLGYERDIADKIAYQIASIWRDKEYLAGRYKANKKSYQRYLLTYNNRIKRKKLQLKELGVDINAQSVTNAEEQRNVNSRLTANEREDPSPSN